MVTLSLARRLLVVLLSGLVVLVLSAGLATAQEESEGGGGVCGAVADVVDEGGGLLNGVAEAGCDAALSVLPGGMAGQAGGAAVEAAVGAGGELAGSMFEKIVNSAANSFANAIIWSSTLWMDFPTATFTQEDLFSEIQANTMWLQIVLLTVSLMIAAGRLAMARSMASSYEEAENAIRTGAKSVLAATLLSGVVIAGGRAGDALANWFVDEASRGNDPIPILENVATAGVIMGAPGMKDSAMLVLVLSVLGILTSLIQILFIILRNMLLIVVVAVVPLAAAASGTQIGKQSYDKLVGFIVALLLFKPVAALVLAVALWTGQSDDPTLQFIGLLLLVLSVLVLPTLMKLVVPAVSAAGMGPSTLAVAAGGAALAGKAGAMIATGGASAAAGGGAGAGASAGGMGGGMGGGAAPTAGRAPTPPSSGGGGGAAGGAGGAGGGGGGGGGGARGGQNSGGAASGAMVGAAAGPAGGQQGGAPSGGASGGGPVAGSGGTFEGHVNPTPERGIGRHEVDQ